MLTPETRHPKPSPQHRSRRDNLLAALQTVAEQGTTSRAAIARATGLTKATVSSLVSELIDQGLVRELGPGPTSRGKPPTVLALNEQGRESIAVDLSSRPFRGAVVDLTGNLRHTRHGDDRPHHGADAVDETIRLVENLLELAEAPVLGIGIGTPGLIAPDGAVIEAANLGWRNVPLASVLARRFEMPVTVVNDAQAAALAEYHTRPRDSRGLLLVRIGQGIGAGIVLDGRLHHGERGMAGEIGHVVVDPGGDPCRCGNQGCLETVASVPAIVARLTGEDPTRPWDALGLAAEFGVRAVRASIRLAAEALGPVLAAAVALLDLGEIVVASDLDNATDAFVDDLGLVLAGHVLERIRPTIHVGPPTRRDLVLRGATAMVLNDQLGVIL